MPLQPSWGAVLQVTACRTPLSGSLHVKRRDGGRLSPCSHPLPRRGKGAARRGRVAVPSNVLGSLLHACSLLGCVMMMVGASSETKGRPLFPVFTYVSATDRLSLDGLPIGCLLDCWRLRLDFWRLRGQQLKPREVTQQNLGRGGWDGMGYPGLAVGIGAVLDGIWRRRLAGGTTGSSGARTPESGSSRLAPSLRQVRVWWPAWACVAPRGQRGSSEGKGRGQSFSCRRPSSAVPWPA